MQIEDYSSCRPPNERRGGAGRLPPHDYRGEGATGRARRRASAILTISARVRTSAMELAAVDVHGQVNVAFTPVAGSGISPFA
jgi:hypothetical protein